MNSFEFGMLILGFMVGLGFGGFYCYSMTKTINTKLNELIRLDEEIHKNLYEKYGNLDELHADSMKLVNDTAQRLVDICSRMSKETQKYGAEIFSALTEDNHNKNKFLKELEEIINYNETVNGERWNLICDYITNKEPEFVKEEASVDNR